MSHSMFRTAVVLGALSCVGPFAIDMYLPALPEIARTLEASPAAVQMTLSAFFLAFGLSQLVYGPWSDQAGRRVPVFTGLAVFVAGSVLCALAPTVAMLTLGRLVQGLGAAVVMVIPRAIVRDLHTGNAATRLMAMIMLVISVSPMLAPLAGSLMLLVFDWRAIFGFFIVAAILSALMTRFALPETLPPERRVPVNLANLRRGARILVTDTTFMGLTLVGGFGMASFFVFIASAPFVYADEFGLTPMQFSLAFAVNAIGFFSASQLAAPIGERIGMTRAVRIMTSGFAFFTVCLLLLALAGAASLTVTVAFLFCANACLGVVIPTTMVLALDAHGKIAGLASSLGGTLQMLAGGAMIALAGPFFDGTVTPMIAAIAACGIGALAINMIALRPRVPA